MRKMIYRSITMVVFAVVVIATTSGVPAEATALDEMQSKIDHSLQSGSWSDASKAIVLAVWDDYKKTLADQTLATTQATDTPAGGGQTDDSVGVYRLGDSKKKLEIRRDKGVLVIVLEGHPIPAVMSDGTFLFTTGDIVTGSLPQLGKRKHASLEFFAIRRSADGLTFGGFARSRAPVPMTKVAE